MSQPPYKRFLECLDTAKCKVGRVYCATTNSKTLMLLLKDIDVCYTSLGSQPLYIYGVLMETDESLSDNAIKIDGQMYNIANNEVTDAGHFPIIGDGSPELVMLPSGASIFPNESPLPADVQIKHIDVFHHHQLTEEELREMVRKMVAEALREELPVKEVPLD